MHARNTKMILERIKTFPAFYPRYRYENEGEVNPGYTVLGDGIAHPIPPDYPMIFCLRADGILAMGVKNAWEEPQLKPITDYFDPSFEAQLKNKSRFGHPTLAMPYPGYKGAVHYAGWLCQRADHIQVYLSSGRFETTALLRHEIYILQTYIAMQFMDAFGQQDVVFHEQRDDKYRYDELIFQFIQNKSVLDPGVRYTPEEISRLLPQSPPKSRKGIALASLSSAISGTGMISSLILSGGSQGAFAAVCTAIPVWGWAILLGASVLALGYTLYRYQNTNKTTSAFFSEAIKEKISLLFHRKKEETNKVPEQEMQPLARNQKN